MELLIKDAKKATKTSSISDQREIVRNLEKLILKTE
jgi:hypothetical protein